MSWWTTESWEPTDCACTLHHMFLEGPDAPAVNSTNKNLIYYCSLDRATEIRKSKHDTRIAFFTDTRDLDRLKKEKIWWKKRRVQIYKEYNCPFHINLTGDIWYRTLSNESQRRQLSYNIITNLQPEKFTGVLIPFEWKGVGEGRSLNIMLPIEDITSMPDLTDMFDIQFGPGKVASKEIKPINESKLEDLLSKGF